MNTKLIAGKAFSVVYYIMAEKFGVKLNKYHSSAMLSILRNFDFELIEEISKNGDFEKVLVKWSDDLKKELNSNELTDIVNILKFSLNDEYLKNDVALCFSSLFIDANDEDKQKILFHLFDSLGIDDVILFQLLSTAYSIPNEFVEFDSDKKKLVRAVFNYTNELRKSIFIYQQVRHKNDSKYNIVSEFAWKAFIAREDIAEIFQNEFNQDDDFLKWGDFPKLENSGYVLLDLLEKLRPLVSNSEAKLLFDSLVRIAYQNRPPVEADEFDLILLRKLAQKLELIQYFDGFGNSFQQISKTYVILPKLNFNKQFVLPDIKESQAFSEVILELCKWY